MGKNFLPVDTREALDTLIDNSKSHPVVVFKHSTACGISAAAYREMEKYEGDVSLVVVQTARDVSRELATITGIRHESPQVIILRNGKAVWNASHYQIKAGAVAQATESAE
ncbi:MAG: bacillithiol system redox-active protein YtxJ [Blastocatellia bacterium]|nr:MAG: bacillithiol system redox-active protein YtxJ [Blastocatellia bacterium]